MVQLIKGVRERIYPVGRLDFHSEGLILLTNDGDLAFKVSHPKHGSVKTYHVKVRGVPEERIVDKSSAASPSTANARCRARSRA